ncbi:hypothetical protein AGOR_G00209400 [Albula goreensis]|uniref:Sema domain-containing protein n=1 Tax=Albula goreensis TaxID=1534307 RepID=A0A8T3CNJ6_9TELE|nr:hypothetical protein AGOR_G00209400 [Albula goreensis]
MALMALEWRVMVLLGLLDTCQALLIPRTTFPIGSQGRSLTHFTSSGIKNTTTLLLSDDGTTLYVGARDYVLSLDVSQPGVMEIKHKVDWSPKTSDHEVCRSKGKSEMDCHNFVRVLQFLNTTHMYACGTNAFNPQCSYMNIESFTGSSVSKEDGRGRCPFNPHQRSTAIAVGGELYTSTVESFLGDKPAISRFLSGRGRKDLKLENGHISLNDPTFVSSSFIPSEGKVYYFFRETGKEYTFINDYTVSRIAQVCTSDVGGELLLQKHWTTFVKAQLRCQAGSDLPFNNIQDIVTLPPPEGNNPDDTIFYGVFSSQWPLASGQSAVCMFRLRDIKNVFAGNYYELNRDTQQWRTPQYPSKFSPGECELRKPADKLMFVKDNFLAVDSVGPGDPGLLLVSPDQLYSRIAAQRTRAANGRDFTVLFLLTESGFLHKTVLLAKGPHIIEEILVFTQPQSVKNMLLSITKGVVFVGSSEGIFQVPVSNCSFYSNCAECVLARDPFCGWDHDQAACVEVSAASSGLAQDVEEGNVMEVCKPSQRSSLPHTMRSPVAEKYVQLNEVVRLECPQASRQAAVRWERPGSILPGHLYLQPANGSLSFLASPLTLGTYRCIAEENGYIQTLVDIIVVQRALPRSVSSTPTHSQPRADMVTSQGTQREEVTEVGMEADWEDETEMEAEVRRDDVREVQAATMREEVTKQVPVSDPTNGQEELPAPQEEDVTPTVVRETSSAWKEGMTFNQVKEPLSSNNVRSYYSELVAVSFLLVVTLCMLVAGGVYVWQQQNPSQKIQQGLSKTDEEIASSQEEDPLSANLPQDDMLKEKEQEKSAKQPI